MATENPYRPPTSETPLAASYAAGGPQLVKTACLWIVAGSAAAAATGAGGRIIRPLISGPVHYEAIAGLMLMILICVGLLIRFRKFPRAQGIFFYALGTTVVWLAHAVGWTMLHGEIWGDVVWLNLVNSAAATLVGMAILWLPRRA